MQMVLLLLVQSSQIWSRHNMGKFNSRRFRLYIEMLRNESVLVFAIDLGPFSQNYFHPKRKCCTQYTVLILCDMSRAGQKLLWLGQSSAFMSVGSGSLGKHQKSIQNVGTLSKKTWFLGCIDSKSSPTTSAKNVNFSTLIRHQNGHLG